jgi:hypothetical protein
MAVLIKFVQSRESAPVKPQRPIVADAEEHRVLQFRPRNVARTTQGWQHDPNLSKKPEAREPNDLSRYERPREKPDDFRQRILANIAGFAFVVALTAIGIWLVVSIADLRQTQDCVLLGRRDCIHLTAGPSI